MTSIQPQTLLLLGGTGFIGSALGEHFTRSGWKVRLVTRQAEEFSTSFPCDSYLWNGKYLPDEALENISAVINLAGAGIADQNWTSDYRKIILNSRVESTRALAKALTESKHHIPVVIQASAIGFYGLTTSSQTYDEEVQGADDFLAKVCGAWEHEAQAMEKKTRLVIGRLGVVLGWEGGALPKLWDIYASGLGSRLGKGQQWMNWIHLEDVVGFFDWAIKSESLQGVYNLVAPDNINNHNFHQYLASKTPSLNFNVAPSWSIQAVMGKRADLILKAPKVISTKCTKASYVFKYPDFSQALDQLIKERTHPSLHYLKVKQWVPAPTQEVWKFISSANNLEKITPDWLNFHIKHKTTDEIELGTKIKYALKLHALPITWESQISKWLPEEEFVDEQIHGPYNIWYHRHLFSKHSGGTLMEDRIEYRLPLFPFGEVVFPKIKQDLNRIFSYRKKTLAELLKAKN